MFDGCTLKNNLLSLVDTTNDADMSCDNNGSTMILYATVMDYHQQELGFINYYGAYDGDRNPTIMGFVNKEWILIR